MISTLERRGARLLYCLSYGGRLLSKTHAKAMHSCWAPTHAARGMWICCGA